MPRALLPIVLLAGCALLGTSAAQSQEWTRFRGPNGQGESETSTIPASWTEQDLNWKIELPGIGHSSPFCGARRFFF